MKPDSPNDQDAERCASEATAWFVRLQGPDATDADRRAFRRWLAGDPQRGEAFDEARQLWSDLETPAAILGEGGWYRHMPKPARPSAGRGLRYAAGLAACLLVTLGALVWRDAGLLDRLRADHATRPGERREIVLAEGSRAYLDGDTALAVRFGADGRRINLLRGRVWFDVVPNKDAPFIVTAGDVETRVLGTAFAVDWSRQEIDVVVERGRVGVSRNHANAVEVSAGQQVRVIDGQVGSSRAADAETALAWRRGLIILDRAPLGRVIDELERMQPGRVMIPDDSLRGLTLSGVFRADDPDAIIEALHSALGLKTVSVPGFATLVYR